MTREVGRRVELRAKPDHEPACAAVSDGVHAASAPSALRLAACSMGPSGSRYYAAEAATSRHRELVTVERGGHDAAKCNAQRERGGDQSKGAKQYASARRCLTWASLSLVFQERR